MFHKASLQAMPSEHLPAAHALPGPLPGIAGSCGWMTQVPA